MTLAAHCRARGTAPARGRAPPESPVPAPRATTGTPRREQVRITSCTCSTVSGSTAISGTCRYAVSPSHS